jgi:hypothetical protein
LLVVEDLAEHRTVLVVVVLVELFQEIFILKKDLILFMSVQVLEQQQ